MEFMVPRWSMLKVHYEWTEVVEGPTKVQFSKE